MIGVGASAGGLEALSQFVSHLPRNFPGTVIVAQHLAPHSKSMMVELLMKQSALPVRQAEHGLQVDTQTIYIVPPNFDINVDQGLIQLTMADEAIRPKPSVDDFFESLARNYKDSSVGIILSGTGSDGAKGIRAIKAAGGLTLAQDDRSAKYDGMPRAAIETGCVDTILPPEQLAKTLVEMLMEHETSQRANALEPKGLDSIFTVIREKLGQDFRQYKPSTIRRRVAKRMATSRAATFDEYFAILQSTPGEVGGLAKELLISVTELFRDPEVWESVTEQLREAAQKQPTGQEFRVWIAGCATGEEAYTMAMILLDLQVELRRQFPIKIFATDLDQDALQEARLAIYSNKDIQNVPPRLRERYFDQKSETTFELIKQVRETVVFARQDLIQNPPFVKLDFVSCRNVMIYFDSDLQRKVLEIFHYSLLKHGILLLGKSESILSTPQLFDTVDKKMKLYSRREVATQSIPASRMTKMRDMEPARAVRRPSYNELMSQVAQRQLNQIFDVAGAIVDDEGLLIQVFGDVSKYLKFSDQLVNLKIATLLPKTAGVEIPILIRKAQKDRESHSSRSHRIGKGPAAPAFHMIVRPLSDTTDERNIDRLYLVTFEAKRPKPVSLAPETSTTNHDGDLSSRLNELEQELHITREHLQTVIEELGVSNEELQSVNEELSSTNEELQASNEELETTNEELQSSNEELTTVNEELTAKSSELKSLSVNLENIQNSINSPLLVLDQYLRLVRYNSDALKVFFISPNDMGREITSLSTVCEIPDFEKLAAETLETGRSNEASCEAAGLNYQVKIMPSIDETKKIIGLILVFSDYTQITRTQERLRASESRTRAIIDASPTLISLKDNMGRYQLVNEAYMRFYGVTESIIGKTDREVLDEKIANQMRDSDLEVFIKRTPIRKEENVITEAGPRALLATRFPIMDSTGRNPSAVGTIALDTTSQVDASRALEQSESRYKAIVQDQAVVVCRHLPDGTLTFTNEAFTLYFGAAPAGQRRSFLDHVDSADAASAQRVLASLSPSHPVEQHENRVSRWNEVPRWVRWIHRGVFNSVGEVVEYQSVGFDVTEYRKQSDLFREREAIFSGVFSNSSDFISIFKNVNGELRLESMNQSAERTLGYAATRLIGQPLREFFAGRDQAEVLARYNLAMSTGVPQVFEEEVALIGLSKFFSTTIVPIHGENGSVERVAAVSRDVSSYKAIANDLMRSKDMAEVANRAKSDFLASMSHELRTPLNVVLGLCQMLELSKLDTDQVNYVNGIHRAGRLLLTLIEDVLDISKIEAGKVKIETISFRLRDLVDDVSLVFASQAREKGLELRVEFELDDQNFLGDPARIRQILVNFVSNALKFTQSGSVTLRVSQRKQMVILSVIDTGIGINSENHPKIFQKFSQAETGHTRRFGGTGLGLAISKQLATLMGGQVGFSSDAGRGSTFWCELPLRRTAMEALPVSQLAVNPTPQTRKLKVLAVDDNIDSRVVVCLFLKKLGHEYDTAESGPQAIERVLNGHFDLVLMDMQMPGMDGCEATIELRKDAKGASIPIIALTANALTQDVERCIACGMDDYLSKPLRIEDLSACLNKWTEEMEVNGRGQPTQ